MLLSFSWKGHIYEAIPLFPNIYFYDVLCKQFHIALSDPCRPIFLEMGKGILNFENRINSNINCAV